MQTQAYKIRFVGKRTISIERFRAQAAERNKNAQRPAKEGSTEPTEESPLSIPIHSLKPIRVFEWVVGRFHSKLLLYMVDPFGGGGEAAQNTRKPLTTFISLNLSFKTNYSFIIIVHRCR